MILRDVYQFKGHVFGTLDYRLFHERDRTARTHRLIATDHGFKVGRRPVWESDWVTMSEPIVLFVGSNLDSGHTRFFSVINDSREGEPAVAYCCTGQMVEVLRTVLQRDLRMD